MPEINMADQPVTREKLINADKDVQVIEDFIKKPKDETVTTRFGDEIMTLKGLEEEVKKSGGYFKRYTTLAAANADIANIPVNGVVKVTSAADGGDYEKVSSGATSLTKSNHDPVTKSKELLADFETKIPYKNLFNKNTVREGKLLNTSGKITSGEGWSISDYIPVNSGEKYSISGYLGSRVSFFASKNDNSDAIQTILSSNPKTVTAPAGANYMVIVVKSSTEQNPREITVELGETPTKYTEKNQISALSLDGESLVRQLDDDLFSEKVGRLQPLRDYEEVVVSPNMIDESKIVYGRYISTNNTIIITSDTSWCTSDAIPVQAGKTYTVSGQRSSPRVVLYADATLNTVVLGVMQTGSSVTFTAPQDCYAVVGLSNPYNTASPWFSNPQLEEGSVATPYIPYGVLVGLNANYIKNIVGSAGGSVNKASRVTIQGDNLTLSCEDHTGKSIVIRCSLTKPLSYDNSTVFNFTHSEIDGVLFSSMGDDVAPYYIDRTVVGANHGYDKIKVTSPGHGKTTADCGSVWSADNRTWVLVAVIDANNLIFMCESQARSAISGAQLIHSSGASNTATIPISSYVSSELFPVLKNRKLGIVVDGQNLEIKNVEQLYSDRVIVKESYEVMLRSDIVANIKSNKGKQLTEFSAPPVFRVNISYVFDHEGGCTIEQDFLILKQTTLESLTMMQSVLARDTNGAVYYYLPKSLPISIDGTLRDFRQPTDIRSLNIEQLQTQFKHEHLENPNSPIDRSIQFNNIGAFATGFLPIADAEPARRLSLTTDRFWGLRSTLKTYPKLLSFSTSKNVYEGEYYSCISYSKWFSKQTEQTACFPVRSSAGDFLYLDWHSTGLKNVKIPNDFKHRSFSVVEKSENINLLSTDFVQDELLVKIQGGSYAYLVLKFK